MILAPVGTVQAIWRYPVKSMAGHQVKSANVSWSGLLADRALVVVRRSDDVVITAKTSKGAALLNYRATFVTNGSVFLSMPGASLQLWHYKPAWAVLSNLLDQEVYIRQTSQLFAYTTDTNFWLGAGSGVDSSPFSLITTASLAGAQALAPQANWDLRRFRPNIVIQSPDAARGFPEDRWVGRFLRTASGMRFHISQRTGRSDMVSCAQRGGIRRNNGAIKALRNLHGATLGVYASLIDPGTGFIDVGEAVYLEDDF